MIDLKGQVYLVFGKIVECRCANNGFWTQEGRFGVWRAGIVNGGCIEVGRCGRGLEVDFTRRWGLVRGWIGWECWG